MNYCEVGHNALEFVIDFGQYDVEQGQAQLHTRIVTAPVCAKLLATMLADAIARFESAHGSIEVADNDLDPVEVVRLSIAGYDRSYDSLGGKK